MFGVLTDGAIGSFYRVDVSDCLPCAACSTLAPGNFEIVGEIARIKRQPQDDLERQQCEAARITCPVGAITVESRRQKSHSQEIGKQ